MPITLPPETVQKLLGSIKRYASDQLDLDVGDLQARLLLDYCLLEIGPVVYNQAIADAQRHMQERVADLDAACYQPEFTYWTNTGKPKKRGE